MSSHSRSVKEEMRDRSRQKILQATFDLLSEQGYEATTLAGIARRAGTARGLISYYFPHKQHLFQAAVHRIMFTRLAETLADVPADVTPDERLAWTIDRVLHLAREQAVVFRSHLALILQPEALGFVQETEREKLGEILRDVVARRGAVDPVIEHALLRSALMGGVIAIVLPGAELPLEYVRADLFARYRLRWSYGMPPTSRPPAVLDRPEF